MIEVVIKPFLFYPMCGQVGGGYGRLTPLLVFLCCFALKYIGSDVMKATVRSILSY